MLVFHRLSSKLAAAGLPVPVVRPTIRCQSPAEVQRIFARAGIEVQDGQLYDATSRRVVPISEARQRAEFADLNCRGK